MTYRFSISRLLCAFAAALVIAAPAHAAADPKVVVKCQATLKKAGAKFIAKKLGALAKCTDAVFKCIQTVDEAADAGAKRTACITKARDGCLKSLAGATAARQAFVGAVTGACATLDAAQVTGGGGLGYAGTDCAAFGAAAATSAATLAECVASQHDCLASQLFQLGVPRALELIQFTPPPAAVVPAADLGRLACLDDNAGTGSDVGDVALGKSLAKCEKAIVKAGSKLAGGRLKTLEKCVDALFACAQTKTGDDLTKCRTKARAGCQKALDKQEEKAIAIGAATAKPCGDASVFAALRTPAGGNLDALLTAPMLRAALSCTSLATIADYQACLVARNGGAVDDVLRFQAPKAEELLAEVDCDLNGCVPVPTPTKTPGGGGGGKPTVQRIIGLGGDGTHPLTLPSRIATDGNGTVYVIGLSSDNVFKIAPNGAITELMGNGPGKPVVQPSAVGADGDVVYVGSTIGSQGGVSGELYKITPGAEPVLILDTDGDGVNKFRAPDVMGFDASHNLYVAAAVSANVFKITPTGTASIVMSTDFNGNDGQGHKITGPFYMTVDPAGVVYLACFGSNNAFKITGGVNTQLIGPNGDGAGNTLKQPVGIAIDGAGTTYVANGFFDTIFKITSGGTITQIVDSTGDGTNPLLFIGGIATDPAGNLFITGNQSHNVFKVTPGGTISEYVEGGDGSNEISEPGDIITDPAGNLYVVDERGAVTISP